MLTEPVLKCHVERKKKRHFNRLLQMSAQKFIYLYIYTIKVELNTIKMKTQ